MISNRPRNLISSSVLQSLSLVTIIVLCNLSSMLWPEDAWGKSSAGPNRSRKEPQKQEEPQKQPKTLSNVTSPSPLSSALAACDKPTEGGDAFSLPGAKGEIKLDSCYKGRDQLVCIMDTLMKEANNLIEDYRKIIDAGYPDLSAVNGICAIKSDILSEDLQKASEFANRFKALKGEYTARTTCVGKIQQSLRDVTLPDMSQAPEVLKSMISSIEGDSKSLAAVQAQIVDFAVKIDSSTKAMITINKIRQAMCVRSQKAADEAGKP